MFGLRFFSLGWFAERFFPKRGAVGARPLYTAHVVAARWRTNVRWSRWQTTVEGS